jgi:hypothetical protein
MPVLMTAPDIARVARALRRLRACRYISLPGVMHAIEEAADDLEEALGVKQREDARG